MNHKHRCAHCKRFFRPNPRVKSQLYCSRKACQRARKTLWQRRKMRTDPDYRDTQRTSQKQWCEQHPDYWREYRRQHPDYCQKNRQLQKERDTKRRCGDLAKMDALEGIEPIKTGTYYLVSPPRVHLAKKDSLGQKVVIISAD